MNRGTRLLLEEVPLSAEAEAEHSSSTSEDPNPQMDLLLSFLVGCLVAGALMVTLTSVFNLMS